MPTILLVSDDAAFSDSVRRAANRMGFALVLARNIAEASHRQIVPPRLVLLDLDSALHDGWEFVERSLEDESSPPIILFTARAHETGFSAAIRSGAVLEKSTEPAHVQHAVNRILTAPALALSDHRNRQKVLIRWLKPISWPVPVRPAQRWWGLNE
jgi:DNA-binding response OmpR family regulator